jgi:methylphosphotriester-DNA--protein-cysteine methyltransferase
VVQYLTVDRRDLDGFDGLQQAVKGTHFDVVQLGRGKLRGGISYVGVGDLTLSLNSFSTGICAQRISADDKLLFGMLLGAADRVSQWSFDMIPGDIVVIPPVTEHHAAHFGASSYACIRLDPNELGSVFAGDPSLSDPENWQQNNRHRAHSDVGTVAVRALSLLADHLARMEGALSDELAEFWQRTIVECMAVTMRCSLPPDKGGHLPSAMKLVRLVEDYLEIRGNQPVHVSEICSRLHLSRRSLHRAFHEIFGIGPVKFLRQKRLCKVHSTLKASAPVATTVGKVAMQLGFVELRRFARDYHEMFGEYPSQTLGGGLN